MDDSPRDLDARPFLIALGIMIVAGAFAVAFLRPDDGGLDVVRPQAFQRVGDAAVTAQVALDHCASLERAQVDQSDDDTVFVEVIVRRDGDGCSTDHVVTIVLPEPIGDRRVLAGVGRVRLPCDPSGRCGAEQ